MRHWDAFRAMNPVPNPRRMRPGTQVRFPARWLRVRAAPPVPGEADTEDFAGDTRIEKTDVPRLILATPDEDIWFRVRVVDTDGYQGPFGTPNRIEAPVEDPWWLLAVPILIILL